MFMKLPNVITQLVLSLAIVCGTVIIVCLAVPPGDGIIPYSSIRSRDDVASWMEWASRESLPPPRYYYMLKRFGATWSYMSTGGDDDTAEYVSLVDKRVGIPFACVNGQRRIRAFIAPDGLDVSDIEYTNAMAIDNLAITPRALDDGRMIPLKILWTGLLANTVVYAAVVAIGRHVIRRYACVGISRIGRKGGCDRS
jgi:hypothetical protein